MSEMELSRRELLVTGAYALGTALLWPRLGRAEDRTAWLEVAKQSPLAYISPLAKDGSESRCHGEVWFAWEGASVVLVTSRESWKARALARGLDRARIWVADFGRIRWNAAGKLANAPRFDARARLDIDPASFQRVIPIYALTQEFIDDFLGYFIDPRNKQLSSMLIGSGLPGGMMGSLMADLKGAHRSINASLKSKGHPELTEDELMVQMFNEVEYIWPKLGYPPLVTPLQPVRQEHGHHEYPANGKRYKKDTA